MINTKFRAYDKEKEFWLNPEHFYITGEGRAFTCEHSKGMYSCEYRHMGTKRYSIGQRTELKDNSGDRKEVYGGDLVKWYPMDFQFEDYTGMDFDETEIGEIVYCPDNARWGIKTKGETTWGYNEFGTIEIVGNTTDNPELLETK